jgi:hypothetical protein
MVVVIPRNEGSMNCTIKKVVNSSAATTMLNKEQDVQVSDTTEAS